MMMFFRSGFAALGAVVVLVSVCTAGLCYFTQRGQATRKRREQRERYLDHLEQLREDLRGARKDSKLARRCPIRR